MQKTPCHPRWSRGRDAAPSERLRRWLRVLALLPGPPPAAPPVARGGAACHTLRAAPLAATTASWTVSWSAAAASSEKHMIRRASVVGVDAFFATWSMTAEPVRWTACTLRNTTLSWTRRRCLNDDEPLPRQHDNERVGLALLLQHVAVEQRLEQVFPILCRLKHVLCERLGEQVRRDLRGVAERHARGTVKHTRRPHAADARRS